jgi:hypothetical protein
MRVLSALQGNYAYLRTLGRSPLVNRLRLIFGLAASLSRIIYRRTEAGSHALRSTANAERRQIEPRGSPTSNARQAVSHVRALPVASDRLSSSLGPETGTEPPRRQKPQAYAEHFRPDPSSCLGGELLSRSLGSVTFLTFGLVRPKLARNDRDRIPGRGWFKPGASLAGLRAAGRAIPLSAVHRA